MNLNKRTIGRAGESIACDYLQDEGVTIVSKNFVSKGGEIDLIGLKENKVIFCEVKTRLTDRMGLPYEAIDNRKLTHLKKAIQYFLLKNPHPQAKLAVWAISVMLNPDGTIEKIKCYQDVDIGSINY